ncbi:hypothetical protein SAMN05518669_13216 [Variovorax sp. YR634]|uniref:hypothetical protein n=1 Tax=Variovorax sp. YR634 TaxID=1884385 RepID=UPI00089634FD|nr:hypothetical protein [Variovorax sp. YR634]SDZ39285.1 hypothetical protein SAMN05518669_13216 [Variovorax sp. YR634]
MTTTPSPASAQRLPRDLALVTVAIDAAMVLVNMAIQLWPDSPHGEQLRSTYALPGVWIPMVFSIGMAWVLAAALAWSHGRNALEKRGVGSVARLPQPRIRYAAVYIAVLVLNFYLLSPLFYEVQLLFMPGGRLHDFLGSTSMSAAMALFTVLQSVAQLILLVLGVWVSAWFALRAASAAPSDAQQQDDDEAIGASPRRAVALVGAAVFASLQMWSGVVVSRWTSVARGMDGLELLIAWMLPPLVAFALAFWGGWLGANAGLARVRPFRAVAAAVLAFVLVQVSCIAIALAWVMLATWSHSFDNAGGLIGFALALVLVYSVLVVVLMRAATRWLYRRD